MRTSPPRSAQPRRRSRVRWALLWTALVVASLAVVAAWWVYRELGRTPGELMDYAERRLEGHPRLEWVALPAMALVRSALDAPSKLERGQLPFLVPPPPPRRGEQEVLPPEPPPPGARVWRVGPRGPLFTIADAAREARSGDVVEIEAGDYRGDVALWEQKRLTIRGVNGAARLFADGRSSEGKAIWVIRNGDFDVSNIDFIGARVQDGNGAGIRFEGGRLRLRDCLFWDNETGLLTSGANIAADATLIIERSEFAYSHVKGRWAHNLYVGTIDSLTVTGSYFHRAAAGHLLKSRARVNDILYNRFTDESGGRASYELDFPNGGIVRLVGNVVQQQSGTENSTLISFGEEGYHWPVNRLHMGSNTLVNDHPHGGTFVYVAPGAQRVVSANNLLVGPGAYRVTDPLLVFNDARADWTALVQPSRQNYRLSSDRPEFIYRPLLEAGWEASMAPRAAYRHPRAVAPLTSAPSRVGAEAASVP